MAFIDRLKAARLEKKLTQEQLAKEIGVAKPTYNGYEKGNSEPNMLILSKLMKVLGVDANYFVPMHTQKLGLPANTINRTGCLNCEKLHRSS